MGTINRAAVLLSITVALPLAAQPAADQNNRRERTLTSNDSAGAGGCLATNANGVTVCGSAFASVDFDSRGAARSAVLEVAENYWQGPANQSPAIASRSLKCPVDPAVLAVRRGGLGISGVTIAGNIAPGAGCEASGFRRVGDAMVDWGFTGPIYGSVILGDPNGRNENTRSGRHLEYGHRGSYTCIDYNGWAGTGTVTIATEGATTTYPVATDRNNMTSSRCTYRGTLPFPY